MTSFCYLPVSWYNSLNVVATREELVFFFFRRVVLAISCLCLKEISSLITSVSQFSFSFSVLLSLSLSNVTSSSLGQLGMLE